MFQHLFELELLKKEWGILLQETEDLLYQDREAYFQSRDEFISYLKENSKGEGQSGINMDIHLEQLLVYFLFTYFPGAVYDGEIYAKAQLAVYCTWMIWEIWMSRWLKNEKSIDLEEMTELVYRFSREVEHSDLNLRAVEEFLSKKWFLKKYEKVI